MCTTLPLNRRPSSYFKPFIRLVHVPFAVVLLGVFVLVVLPVASGQAQQPAPSSDTTRVKSALTESLEAALDRFEAAQSPTAADSADLRRWADSLRATGNSIRTQQAGRARTLLKQVLRARRALGDSVGVAENIGDVGVTYRVQSQLDTAIEQFREALKRSRGLSLREEVASNLANIGLARRIQGRYDRALARLREALETFRNVDDREGATWALRYIGSVHQRQGDYETALTHYQEALARFHELDDRKNAAHTLDDIGIVHKNRGRYEEAMAALREALPLFRELGDRDGIAWALNSVGLIYKNQGRNDQALSPLQDALKMFRNEGDRHDQAVVLNNIGLVHSKQGRSAEAVARLQEALSIFREVGDQKDIAITLNSIGRAYKRQGRDARALAPLRKALRVSQDIGRELSVVNNFADIGNIHLRRGDLRSATDTVKRAVRLADELRLNTASAEARRSLLSTQIEAYQALGTAHVRGERPDSALRTLERARARLLADRLAGAARGDTTVTIPPADELRGTLGAEEAALLYANAGTGGPLTALVVRRDTIIARTLPDSTVRAEIKEAYPTRLNRLRGEERTAPPDDQPSLAATIRLYRYYLTREGAGASIRRDLAQRLCGLLVAPLEAFLRETEDLTIVPTGTLGYLPFETLQDGSGQHLIEEKHVRYSQSLTTLRQLQQRTYGRRETSLLALGGATYESTDLPEGDTLVAEARGGSTRVATTQHASALLRSTKHWMEQGKTPRPTYLKPGYRTWTSLPGTEKEAETLGNVAEGHATILTDTSASEQRVRRLSERGRLAEHRRLHFATHGIAVPETPKLSALVLSQANASDSFSAKDGYLTMEESAKLDMRADVAALSACQTGLGRIIAGEGVVSLSHAFLRAGANATLVSQWKVLDESTRQFMTAVYERAKADTTSFARAVTETKRAFIVGEQGEKNMNPLRWAPFVYYGRE